MLFVSLGCVVCDGGEAVVGGLGGETVLVIVTLGICRGVMVEVGTTSGSVVLGMIPAATLEMPATLEAI